MDNILPLDIPTVEVYQKMMEQVKDYAIILLDPNGIIRMWNKGAQKIKQYSELEAIGMSFKKFYLPEDQEKGLPDQLLEIAKSAGSVTHEGWRVRKDQSRFWGNVLITALHDKDGSLLGFTKLTKDLTEQKDVQDQLKEYLRQLEFKNKELEQFAYVAAHDLQEPLRKIRTFADIVRQTNETTEINKYLSKINTSAFRLSQLIESILDYSRVTQKKFAKEACDLNHILLEVLDDYEMTIQSKKVCINNNLLPTIWGFPIQLQQLFSNLIGNALKFSSKTPKIDVEARIIPAADVPHRDNHPSQLYYHHLLFADNGIGFDPAFNTKIFTLFQRLDSSPDYPGTGIGLTLCKRIMENHAGFIKAEGRPGNGADFHLFFPVLAEPFQGIDGNIP